MTATPISTRELLHEELRQRQKKNQAYSLRSFAQRLEVSPSYLSLVFKGQRRLTQTKAQSFGRKLAWPAYRRRYFALLAEFENAKSENDQQILLNELEKLSRLSRQIPSLEVDRFALMADWHHSAILALLTLPKFTKTSDRIAKRLNISQPECDLALSRLVRLGLADQNEKGQWSPTHNHLQIHSTPSKAIQLYHKEVLRKAMVAVDAGPIEARDFSTWVFTVDPSTLPEAKKRIQDFQKELMHLMEGKNPSQVYQISSQLFRVDQDSEKNGVKK